MSVKSVVGLLRRLAIFSAAFAIVATCGNDALAQKTYDTGATDTEIKIGNILPYSGPASSYGVIGKTEEAFFKKINAEGGVNGRKIKFISYDDGYNPQKTVEQARKLVEGDGVLLIFNSQGTVPNTAIQKYLNSRKVPQLFVSTGATKWNNPRDFPWTMGWRPNLQSEAQIYAKYLLREKPNAKIAVLYQNDDYGKDYLKGLKDGLGAKAASMIVAEQSYEATQPTIDSEIVKLKSSGADVFVDITIPKFAAQAIRKTAEIKWKPLHFLNSVSSSIGATIAPAGFDAAQDIISSAYMKDPTDPQWKTDAGMTAFNTFLDKYYPEADRNDELVVFGYSVAQTMVYVLKQCGDNLTRQNVMKQAASIKGLELDGLLPGITIDTSATDYAPIEGLRLQRFQGRTWHLFGEIMNAETAH